MNKPVETIRAVVVDVDIKFGTMVWLIVKFAIAAIPAALILSLLAALIAVLFRLLAGGNF